MLRPLAPRFSQSFTLKAEVDEPSADVNHVVNNVKAAQKKAATVTASKH